MARQKITNSQQTNSVSSQANAGNAGGTMYYVNLGGIKILWANSATVSTSTTATQFNFTLPTSFFTTVQFASAAAFPITNDAKQTANIATYTTSNVGVYMWASTGATGQATILVIGT